jgi:GntR family transcriptional regulator
MARVEPSSPVPLYHQIANVMQVRIFGGTSPPGARLGTEKELALEFGVSRITIRKAIEILQRDDLLVSQRGRGTFVSDTARPVGPTALHVSLDDILARSEILKVEEIDRAHVPAPADVARGLNVKLGTKVVRIRRRMLPRDDPDSGVLATYFVPRDVWRMIELSRRGNSLLPEIDRLPGLRLTHGRELIQATAADAETANLIDVPPGAALLRLERQYQTASGRTVVFGWVERKSGGIRVLLSRARR